MWDFKNISDQSITLVWQVLEYCWQIDEEGEGRRFEPPWPITDLSDLICIYWTNFSLTWKLLWTYPSNHRIPLWVIWLQNCSTWKIVAIKLKRWMQSSVLYKKIMLHLLHYDHYNKHLLSLSCFWRICNGKKGLLKFVTKIMVV